MHLVCLLALHFDFTLQSWGDRSLEDVLLEFWTAEEEPGKSLFNGRLFGVGTFPRSSASRPSNCFPRVSVLQGGRARDWLGGGFGDYGRGSQRPFGDGGGRGGTDAAASVKGRRRHRRGAAGPDHGLASLYLQPGHQEAGQVRLASHQGNPRPVAVRGFHTGGDFDRFGV